MKQINKKLFFQGLTATAFVAIPTIATGSCSDIPVGGGEKYTSWMIDKETGRQINDGEIVPTSTRVIWHGRAEAYGRCDIYVYDGPSGQCVLGTQQERVVAKIARAYDNPKGYRQLYHDTFGRYPEGGTAFWHVLDTRDKTTSTGPVEEMIYYAGPYKFFSSNIILTTACKIQPERLNAPVFTIYGRSPVKRRCNDANKPALFGNPCNALTGVKSQVETDFLVGPIALTRYYNSDTSQFDMGLGLGWSSQLTRRVERGNNRLNIVEPDGSSEVFVLSNGVWSGDAVTRYSVSEVAGEYLVRSKAGTIERFSPEGRLLASTSARGQTTTYLYDTAGRLNRVEDNFGRWLSVSYSGSHIAAISNAAGQTVTYQYADNGTLSSVTYPDGTQRSYSYDVRLVDQYVKSALLTSIVDERGVQISAWIYAADEKVISSTNAPSTPAGPVNTHQFNYGSGVNTVLDPLGVTWELSYITSAGSKALTEKKNLSDGTSFRQEFDYYGNRTGVVHQDGVRDCYSYDSARNLELRRVEGVPPENTYSCGYVSRNMNPLPSGARRISTQWHPDWDFKTRVAEPGRITTWVYHGQPDPFNGGATASCAPVDALLPDGSPIAVPCRRVEQATVDASGANGFSTELQPDVALRQWTWTYNRWGQVLSEDGPRTDVDDTTTYAYYNDTTAEHTVGDLQRVINASGLVTQYTRYNPHGQLLQMVDANGVVTDYTYDLRQRLTSVSVDGRNTRFDYLPTGLLQRATQPDDSYIDYSYDDAHRLVAVADSLGNRIEYTLDSAGNRIGENVRDPSGALSRSLARSFDVHGRVQQVTGRE